MFALRCLASASALYALFLAILAVTVQAVEVSRYETNAQRMARGLPPRRPKALFPDSTKAARRSQTSSKPATCPFGLVSKCCAEVESSDSPTVAQLFLLYHININEVVPVGLNCFAGNIVSCSPPGIPLCCQEPVSNFAIDCSPFP